MSTSLKVILWLMMTTALACGFLHHVVPSEQINFERLHIFLFNLCSGGTLLVYYTEGQTHLTLRTRLFLLLAVAFAFSAFLHWYAAAMGLSLALAWVVERARVKHFGSVVPRALFAARESTTRKFHQAALLCLSIGLAMSSIVMLNSVYLHWWHIEKLKLDTFFLGFSFPVSLISMSVIFSLMQRAQTHTTKTLKAASFWVINLGVIIFFLFILANMFEAQVFIATTLFVAVAYVFWLYWRQGIQLQQKAFLSSGILFLLITSITGIAYIVLASSPYYIPEYSQPLLRLHAFTALYGWNLSGLMVIGRHDDFPLQLHSSKIILLHWFTVLVLCPLGYFLPLFAVLAVLAYAFLLRMLLFNQGAVDEALRKRQQEQLQPAQAG
ncbi:MAG: hypothetical protein GX087_06350 [Desulfobulbaceae bacterium]|nr:hypothetical protein [Desulfobulbaceae bacterium]